MAQREHDAEHVPAEEETEHWLESFRLLAIKHDIDIVAGTIVEKGKELKDGKEVLSNVAHYITRKGEIVGKYKKVSGGAAAAERNAAADEVATGELVVAREGLPYPRGRGAPGV